MESTINGKYMRWSPVFMRLAFGMVFVVAGAGKLFAWGPKATGIEGFAGFLASLGVPMPELFAWIVAFVEFFGGLAILLGLFTRYAAALVAVDMAAATWLVHVPNGFVATQGGFEFTLVLMLVSIALMLSGPGALSLEYALFGRELLPGARADDRVGERVKA